MAGMVNSVFDLANYYWNYLTGQSLQGASAKDIPFVNDFNGLGVIHENTKSFKAQEGDIVVFNSNYGSGHGHVAVVLNGNADGNYMKFISLDQNWQGGGWTSGPAQGGTGWEPATRITHAYDFPMWFIRPIYKEDSKVVTESGKKPAKKPAKNKAKKLSYNRDKVAKSNILGKRGHKPSGIILHNDASSGTAMGYHNQLVNASSSRLEQGIAHSYISGNTVWQALPESYIAWHAANEWANRNLYGIEICQSMSASDKDFLANEQAAFQESARLLKKWKLPVNRDTVRLHNEYAPTECPHRSMELHAGYKSNQRAPQSVINKTKDYFISQIKQYYNGKIPTGSTVKPSEVKPVETASNGWKKNGHGTWYKSEKATFTCGNQSIITRMVGPFLSCPIGYSFQPGGYTNYDEVMLQDKHCWVGYNWQGTRYFIPIRTWNGVAPGHPGYSVGPLWGSIS